MINELKNTILKEATEKYPQLVTPTAMMARITSVKKLSKKYKRSYKLKDLTTGEEKEYELTGNYYSYSIKVIDAAGTVMDKYPSMPNVVSSVQYSVGDTVTVVFIGGNTTPAIVGG